MILRFKKNPYCHSVRRFLKDQLLKNKADTESHEICN
jgi:hypothetical protein